MPVLHFTISGNAGAAGVLVSATGAATGSATSAADGTYTIGGLIAGAYTITPTLAGATFTPSSSSQTIVAANITGVNFVAQASGFSPAAGVTDNFTRPNAPTLGPNWTPTTDLNSSLAIVSNKAVANSGTLDSIDIYSGATFANDQFVSVTLAAVAATGQVAAQVRGNLADTTGYFVIVDGSTGPGNILLKSANGPTPIGVAASENVAPGDVVKIQAVGSLITVFYNGVPVVSATDTNFTSGSPVVEVVAESVQTDTSISSFSAGPLASSGTGTPTVGEDMFGPGALSPRTVLFGTGLGTRII